MPEARPSLLLAGLLAAWGLAAAAPARSQQEMRLSTSRLDPALSELRRASAQWTLRSGPTRRVIDQVCLVPDAATFYEALATWDDTHYFPILIDDVELDLKFLRAFRPARIVRYPGRGKPIEKEEAWDRAVAAVGEAWSPNDAPADARFKGDAKPVRLGKTPPGAVVGRPGSESLPGLAALAAGRFQPMIRLDSPKGFGDRLQVEDLTAFLGGLDTALRAKLPEFARLGDDCDFLTLAGDYPYVFNGPKGALAVDDVVGRGGANGERWAYAGRLMGDARQSVYAAMCSLFLRPEAALLFDGYSETDEQKKLWGLRQAAARLAPVLPIRLVGGHPNASAVAWHAATDPTNRFGLVLVNSHGSPTMFHVMNGSLHALDVMPSVPAAVSMIHSYSAADPREPGQIAGRWLAQGAFLYHGSMDEPYLPAFRLPTLVADLLSAGMPIAAALRPTRGEPFGQPWKLVVLGDPLYTIRRVELEGPRLRDYPSTPEWVVYILSPPPPPDAPEPTRLGWAVNAALLHTTSSGADPSDRILAVLRSVDRARLTPPFRAIYDDLKAVLEYQTRQFEALRTEVAAIPAAERTAVAARLALSGTVAEFQAALARKDFERAAALWAELLRGEGDGDFKKLVTGRLGTLADTPSRRDIWRIRLRAASSRLGEPLGPAIVGDELRRNDAALEVDRARPPR